MPDKWTIQTVPFASAMSKHEAGSAVDLARVTGIGRATAERVLRGEGIGLATAVKISWRLLGTGADVTEIFEAAK